MVNVLYVSMTFFRAVAMPSTKYCCCILIALVHVGASQNKGMVTSHLKKKKKKVYFGFTVGNLTLPTRKFPTRLKRAQVLMLCQIL